MAQGTPTSRILETIKEVAAIQEQLAKLVEVVRKLSAKVEDIEAFLKSDRT
jgi:hypothetical protein